MASRVARFPYVPFPAFSRRSALAVLSLAVLLGGVYWDVLGELLEEWSYVPDYRPGPLLVLGALVLVWTRAPRMSGLPAERSPWGYPLLAAGTVLYLVAVQTDFILAKRLGLWLTLGGLGLVFWGAARCRQVALAWFALLLAMPFPPRVYTLLAQPLHRAAAAVVVPLADLAGAPMHTDAYQFWMTGFALPVPEALVALRTLPMVLGGAVLLAAWPRTPLRKAVVLAVTVPALLGVAVARLVVTAVVAGRVGPEAAQSFYGATGGRLLYVVVLAVLAAAAWSMRERRRSRGAGQILIGEREVVL